MTYMRKKGSQQTMKVVTIIAMVLAAFLSLLSEILAFSLMNLCISLAFSPTWKMVKIYRVHFNSMLSSGNASKHNFPLGVKLTLVTCEVSPSSVRMAASPGVFREDPLTSEELTTLVTTLLVASGEDLEVKTLSWEASARFFNLFLVFCNKIRLT